MNLALRSIVLISTFLLTKIGLSHTDNKFDHVIDSIERHIQSKDISPKNIARSHYNLAYYNSNNQNPNAAINHAKKSLSLSIKIAQDSTVELNYRMLGEVFAMKSMPDSSFFYLNKGLLFSKEKKMLSSTLLYHKLLANHFSGVNKIQKALSHFDKAEKISHSINDHKSGVFISNAKAKHYIKYGLFDQAIKELKQAENYIVDNGIKNSLYSIYDAFGKVYSSIEQYNKANLYYLKALQEGAKATNKPYWNLGRTHVNLSQLHEKTGKHFLAISQIDSAIHYFSIIDNLYLIQYAQLVKVSLLLKYNTYKATHLLDKMQPDSLAPQLRNIYYYLQGKKALKITNTTVAIEWLEKINDSTSYILFTKEDYHLLLSEIYSSETNTEKSFYHYKKSINADKDSLLAKAKNAVIKEEVRSYLHEKDKQIIHQEIERIQQENKTTLGIVIGLAVFCIFIVLFILMQQRIHSQKNKVKLIEKEQKILLQENKEVKHELSHYSFSFLKSQEFLSNIKNQIKNEVPTSVDVKEIQSKLKYYLSQEEKQQEFHDKLSNIQQNFFSKLDNHRFTKQEKKVAALLKLDQSSKQIADVLNVSEKTIEIYRSKIRKKLSLNKSDNLVNIIQKM